MNDSHILRTQDALNRRVFLKTATAGAGLAALTSLMGRIALGGEAGDASKFGGLKRPAAFCSEGETDYLSAPVRRAVAV